MSFNIFPALLLFYSVVFVLFILMYSTLGPLWLFLKRFINKVGMVCYGIIYLGGRKGVNRNVDVILMLLAQCYEEAANKVAYEYTVDTRLLIYSQY